MNIVCLDMEGVLVPEIWIAFAEASGIPELRRTTRDEPDYGKLMAWRLGLFCTALEVAPSGEITGYKMRCQQSKLTTVKALQSIGYETIASGDSYNDLGMIQASKAGFLFKSTEKIKADHPELPAYEEFDDLLRAIKQVL